MRDIDEDKIFDALSPGGKDKISRKDKLLDELEEIDADDYDISEDSKGNIKPSDPGSFLASRFLKEEDIKNDDANETADDWFSHLVEKSDIKVKANKHKKYDKAFGNGKKKKKKDKNGNEITDFNKEFETEKALLNNLLIDQNNFVDTLQNQYNQLVGKKSYSRGITKNLTDLINDITQGRSTSLQIVDKTIALKKTIADLTMKQKKELGQSEIDTENLSDFASSYLKKMIDEKQQYINGTGSADIGDYTNDEMVNLVSENIGDVDKEFSDETEKYLKYENSNVQIIVKIHDDNEDDYEFEARDEDGNVISDYPLPFKNKISVNRSTNIATDIYGQKYNIEWV